MNRFLSSAESRNAANTNTNKYYIYIYLFNNDLVLSILSILSLGTPPAVLRSSPLVPGGHRGQNGQNGQNPLFTTRTGGLWPF